MAADLQNRFSGDAILPSNRISDLDKLYLDVTAALDNLVDAVGLKAAYAELMEIPASGSLLLASNANKIHVTSLRTV